MSYLNKEGLQYLLQKIKEKIDSSRRPKPNWNAPEDFEASILGRTHYATLISSVNYEITSSSYSNKEILHFYGGTPRTAFRIYIQKIERVFTLSRSRRTITVNVYNRPLTFDWSYVGSGVVLRLTTPSSGEITKLEIEAIEVAKKLHSGYIDDDIARTYQLAEIQNEIAELSEKIASNGVLIEDLQNMKIDKENDDYYPKMAVGLADNLAGVDVVDSEINFRRSGGGAISDGVARIESIKGNSVVWNNQSGTLSIDSATDITPLPLGATFVSRHKYLYVCDKNTDSNIYIYYREVGGSNTILANPKNANSFIFSSSVTLTANGNSSVGGSIWLFQLALNGATEYGAENIRIYDLTKMFGAGNEPSTIENFYARIPMGVDLNAYNEGEVIHMDVQSIESVGVNQWDEEWELGGIDLRTGALIESTASIRSKNFNEIMGGKSYAIYCPSVIDTNSSIVLYDNDYQLVDFRGFYTSGTRILDIPQKVRYFKIAMNATYGTTYKGDICINLSDASINGKYFPHIKRVEDLSIIHNYFPQGMKSAGTAHDEIRYNAATGKKEKVVRIGEVDMGTLKWTPSATYPSLFYAPIADIRPSTSNGLVGNILTSKYATLVRNNIHDYDKSCALDNVHNVFVKDSAYTDAASFKAAMSGVMLYYESNDWEWEELDEADQYQDPDYQVWNGGTEKANTDGKSAPLAADISYGFNAIGKIKELEEAIKALQTTVAS